MKLLTILLFCFFSGIGYSQNSNYVLLQTGKKIDIYDSLRLANGINVAFENKNGKFIRLKNDLIHSIYYKGRTFVSLKVTKKYYAIREIVAYSDDRILTRRTSKPEHSAKDYYYIYNRDFEFLEQVGVWLAPMRKKSKADDLVNLNKIIEHFSDYSVFINMLKKNLDTYYKINYGIATYQCGAAESVDINAFFDHFRSKSY